MLKISDAISNSLRRSFVEDRLNIIEHRYINELRNSFFSGPNGQIASYGIRPVMNFEKMKINADVLKFILDLKAALPEVTNIQKEAV